MLRDRIYLGRTLVPRNKMYGLKDDLFINYHLQEAICPHGRKKREM